MWPIDEYAIIVRICLWFIPITPPTRAFVPAINIINCVDFWGKIKARIAKGASFCHVDRIKQEVHEIEDITEGYQKWQGTLPSFNRIAVMRAMGIKLGKDEKDIHIDILDISNNADPMACARKYLIEPSVSWLFFVCIIMGINLKRFNSIAAHRRIQFVLDKAIKVLIIRNIDVSIIIGEYIKVMKIMEELNPPIRIRSSYISRLIYEDQSSDPSFHSWIKPSRRINRNNVEVVRVTNRLLERIIVGIGISKTISISNTIKMIASRKNRIENGIRAVLLGSNPHSNGEDFSRSSMVRVLRIHAARSTIKGTIRAMVEDAVIRFID